MSELAQRAVACKGWRWMPGMRGHDRGKTFVVISAALDSYTVRFDLPVKQPRRQRPLDLWRFERSGGPPALPDLTDPATLGCLLSLVREVWGDPYVYVLSCAPDWFTVCSPDAEGGKWLSHPPIDGPTEAEALVAALEAAP